MRSKRFCMYVTMSSGEVHIHECLLFLLPIFCLWSVNNCLYCAIHLIRFYSSAFASIHEYPPELFRWICLPPLTRFWREISCNNHSFPLNQNDYFEGKLQAHWNSFTKLIEDPTVVSYSSFVVIKFIYARKYHSLCSNKFIPRLLSIWHCKSFIIANLIHEAVYTNLSRCMLWWYSTSIM